MKRTMKPALGIRDSYRLYRKESKKPVSLQIFLDITNGFATFITDVLLEGEEVCLPERLGTLQYVGKKVKPRIMEDGSIGGLSPNWKETMLLWEKDPQKKIDKVMIYHFNEHSNGIRYRLHWSKKKVFIRNKDFYVFRLSSPNKEKFSAKVREGYEYYEDSRKFYKQPNN